MIRQHQRTDEVPWLTLDLDQYDGRYLMMAWPKMPFVKGSYSAPLRGQYTTLFGAAGEPELGGRLIFAGEHCSIFNQGFMNGAVETGNLAAQLILKKRPRALTGKAYGK